jgi:hypothetical protein
MYGEYMDAERIGGQIKVFKESKTIGTSHAGQYSADKARS